MCSISYAILLESLADRLSEAFAELLHLQVRKDYWGYVPEENLSLEEMFHVDYQGIRPAREIIGQVLEVRANIATPTPTATGTSTPPVTAPPAATATLAPTLAPPPSATP